MKLALVTFLLASQLLFLSGVDGRLLWLQCKARCSKAEFKERCMKLCTICCQKCSCVPSLVIQNKHECYCYMDMKNYKGLPKCP